MTRRNERQEISIPTLVDGTEQADQTDGRRLADAVLRQLAEIGGDANRVSVVRIFGTTRGLK